MNKTCTNCNNKGRLSTKLQKYVCNDCSKLDEFTLIVKTTAKNTYLFTDDNLYDLDEYKGKTQYGPATYYIKKELDCKACQIYNVDMENLRNFLTNMKLEKDTKKEQKSKLLEEKNKIKMTERKGILTDALNTAGVHFREDSELCHLYIMNKTSMSLENIVKRMCQMKYLYEYCNMDKCRNIAYQKYKEEIRAGYFPDCSVSDMAEDIALERYSNGKYPSDVYPWQNNISNLENTWIR